MAEDYLDEEVLIYAEKFHEVAELSSEEIEFFDQNCTLCSLPHLHLPTLHLDWFLTKSEAAALMIFVALRRRGVEGREAVHAAIHMVGDHQKGRPDPLVTGVFAEVARIFEAAAGHRMMVNVRFDQE